jgi:hypothetical protein
MGRANGTTLSRYNTCSMARWKDVAVMRRGKRLWWKRENGDDHTGILTWEKNVWK